jgi:hypothetical protein
MKISEVLTPSCTESRCCLSVSTALMHREIIRKRKIKNHFSHNSSQGPLFLVCYCSKWLAIMETINQCWDPDPYVFGPLNPDPSPSCKNCKKSSRFLLFCDSDFLPRKSYVNVPSKSNKQNNLEKKFSVGILKVKEENNRIRIRIHWLGQRHGSSGSGSVPQHCY